MVTTTLNEILDRAEVIAAQRGVDPHQNPVIDGGMALQALVPHAWRYAILKEIRDGSGSASKFARTHNLEPIEGVAVLPDSVMTEHFDSSFLVNDVKASFHNWPDYARRRHTMLCYFTERDGNLHYSCTFPAVVLESAFIAIPLDTQLSHAGDPEITEEHVGHRLYLYNTDDELVFDGIIKSIVSNMAIEVEGKCVNGTIGFGIANPGTIYDTSQDIVLRTQGSLGTTEDLQTIAAPADSFVQADVGRRLRVTRDSDGSVLVDAIIDEVNDTGDVVTVRGLAIDTVNPATGAVMYPALLLNIVSTPDSPAAATTEIEMDRSYLEDTILILVGALTGEIKIEALLGNFEPE